MGNSPVSRWLAAAALLACTAIVPASAQEAPDPSALPASARAEYDRVLQDERARLMRELVAIEERRRNGKPKPRDTERRPALVVELERVLAALDEAPGGGQGAAA